MRQGIYFYVLSLNALNPTWEKHYMIIMIWESESVPPVVQRIRHLIGNCLKVKVVFKVNCLIIAMITITLSQSEAGRFVRVRKEEGSAQSVMQISIVIQHHLHDPDDPDHLFRIIITIIITRRREVVHNQLCKSAASRGRCECNTLDMLVTRLQPQHSGRIFKEK